MGKGTSSVERQPGMLVKKKKKKKASKNAFHKQPLASLRHHSHKTPAPATAHNQLDTASLQPAFCSALRQAAAEASRAPWRLLPGPKPELDYLPPPHHHGRKAPAELGREGVSWNDPSPSQGFQDNVLEMVTFEFPTACLAEPCPCSHPGASSIHALSSAWGSASPVRSPAGLHSGPQRSSDNEPQLLRTPGNTRLYGTPPVGHTLC